MKHQLRTDGHELEGIYEKVEIRLTEVEFKKHRLTEVEFKKHRLTLEDYFVKTG